jgi:hypothetical protein
LAENKGDFANIKAGATPQNMAYRLFNSAILAGVPRINVLEALNQTQFFLIKGQ